MTECFAVCERRVRRYFCGKVLPVHAPDRRERIIFLKVSLTVTLKSLTIDIIIYRKQTTVSYRIKGVFTMEILRTENLVKTYGKGENAFNAVDGISMSVKQGEFVAIVGQSGSGKSTLMHMLGGVDRPTSGSIFIDGNEINKMNNDKLAIFRRRQIGIVYQFYNLIPILTAEENITLPLELDGKSIVQERVDEVMNALGIADKKRNLPNQLSGGQQQRVSIARAIINNPAILLADEPTGNLDSKATDDIVSILKMTNKTYNQTIIMITHNLEIAKEADRIIRISDGKLTEEE